MPIYTILAAAVEHATEEKNSDFLTFLHPVTQREEAMAWVEQYRARYSDASHVCWAYVIGNTRQPLTQAFSDDGEPSGTAGKPMLHVLTERDIGNALAVVVRYFGGVKLGAGGLVRAYSAAVSEAVGKAEVVQITPQVNCSIHIDFAREALVRRLLQHYKGELLEAHYGADVSLEVQLAEADHLPFCQQLTNETAGQARIKQHPASTNND